MAYFGKEWRVNRFTDGATPTYHPLGKIKEATPQVVPRTSVETATDTRSIDKVISELAISMDILLLLQRWDYIVNYAIISGEGSVPSHTLRWTDGGALKEFQSVKVNTCRFTIPIGELIKVALNVIGKDMVDFTGPSWASWGEKGVRWNDVTTLTLGGTNLLGVFREVNFEVNNNVMQEYYGTGIKPQEVEEGEATYSASIVLPRKLADQIATALAGTEPTFVVAIKTREATPVTKTFTFNNCSLGTRIEVRGLALELEAIDLEPESLTVS